MKPKPKPKNVKCKSCRYYIRFNKEINDKDICGFTINIYTDPIGKIKAVVDEDDIVCEECGNFIEQKGKIKYLRCATKNIDSQCLDFKNRTIANIITDIRFFISDLINRISNIINHNIAIFSIAWILFNSTFIVQTYKDGKIMLELLVPYSIISVIYFIYVMILHKDKQ